MARDYFRKKCPHRYLVPIYARNIDIEHISHTDMILEVFLI